MAETNSENRLEAESFLSKMLNLFFSKEFIKQGLRFAIVGAIGTFVNLSFLYIFTEIYGIMYLLSEAIAFIVALINNYIFNKIWTFEEEIEEKIIGKGIRYTIINIIALIVNLIILFFLVEYYNIFYLIAEIGAALIAFVVNFLGNRFWTFKKDSQRRVKIKKEIIINKNLIAVIMGCWLVCLGFIDITIGLILTDNIFLFLGTPPLIVGLAIIIKLSIDKILKSKKD